MHTIPFHSKEGSEGNGTHAMQIASFGDDVLDSDPQTEEGSKAFKIVMEGGLPTIEIQYHCAQDKKSQRKSRKHANVAKH